MNIFLGLIIFAGATYLGHLIYNGRKVGVSYRTSGSTFTICYEKRVINVELKESLRIPVYSRSKGVEHITIPKRPGNLGQAEHFVTRSKTTLLANALFRFSEVDRMAIVRYDPINAKALIDVQLKLKCFIRNP